jgi:type VI secretion system secreted protein Hcp
MPFDAFMKIDGIDGESTDDKHQKWIELESYSHSIDQPSGGSRSTAGGGSTGRANFGNFNVVKVLDKADPKLALYVCEGTHCSEITIEICEAAGDKQKYMSYKLENCIVARVEHLGTTSKNAAEAQDRPKVRYGFNVGKLTWTYTETDHTTGKPKGDMSANWDVTTNTGG